MGVWHIVFTIFTPDPVGVGGHFIVGLDGGAGGRVAR